MTQTAPDTDAAGISRLTQDTPPPVASTRSNKLHENRLGYLLIAPAVLLLAVAFFFPVLRMVYTSITMQGGFSLERYRTILGDTFYLEVIWRTVWIALLATVISLVLAYPVALYMRQMKGRSRAILSMVMLSPLLISVVVRTLGWLLLLAPTGFINEALGFIGLDAISVLNSKTAVVLGLVHVYFGYMTLSLMISILKIDENVLLAAADLGAKKWQIFWHIILPLSMPGIRAGCMLVFALAASAYITPSLLGSGTEPLLAERVYDSALQYADFPTAATFATILLFVIVAGMTLIAFATRTASERRRKSVTT